MPHRSGIRPPSVDTAAVLLLCGHFTTARHDAKPLTAAEYHRLSTWLGANHLAPGDLVRRDVSPILRRISGVNIGGDRIATLLRRGHDLERAWETWTKAGIWALGGGDPGFPAKLHQRLKSATAPVIFGAGDPQRLNRGGICIVGSRDSNTDGLVFARRLGARCGGDQLTVISSDMRGIDREAISATLGAGGDVISVLSDSLVKAVAAKRNREALSDGRLTLVTPFSPETRFTVANAMRANKYQYALSDIAVVIETRRTGGIWAGAEENRTEGWVPGFVRAGDNMSPGNLALRHLGYRPMTADDIDGHDNLANFFLGPQDQVLPSATAMPDLYGSFLTALRDLLSETPTDENGIAAHFQIELAQVRVWLDRATAEGRIRHVEDSTKLMNAKH